MTGDVSTEAPAYAAALEQYTDPARSYFATRSLPRLLLGPRDRDERLSGIRFPPPERDLREWAKREPPPRPLDTMAGFGAWYLIHQARSWVQDADALQRWEGEGGSQTSGYRPLPYPLTRCLRCNSVRDIGEMVFSEWNVRGRDWPAGVWTHRRFVCMPCHRRDYPEDGQ